MKEKNQTKIVLALTVFFLTVNCATYHSKPISPAQTALSFESRTLDNPDLRRFIESNFNHAINPWPPNRWDFTTLTLSAFYYSPDLDVARAKWGTARAGVITAGQRPNPRATFTPEYATHSPTGISPWILSFALDIPIETAGKRGYRIAQAKHLSATARLNIATAAWQVRSRLRTNLLDLFAAMETDSILKRQLLVQEEIVALLEKRLAYGAISRPVVTQAHISLDQTRLSVDEAEKEIAQARVRLAESLGLPVAALDGVVISFDFLDEFPKELPSGEIQKQALLSRPDILSALSGYEAAQSALQLEIARQYPNLVIGPGYQYDQGENKWSIGFSISLPVFNQNQGPIAEAEARRKEMSGRFTAIQSAVIGEIDLAMAGYIKVLKKLKTAETLLALQKQQEQSIRTRFNSGQTDRLALASAQLELATTSLSRLKALYHAQQALGFLEDAIWRPLGPAGPDSVNFENHPGLEREDSP